MYGEGMGFLFRRRLSQSVRFVPHPFKQDHHRHHHAPSVRRLFVYTSLLYHCLSFLLFFFLLSLSVVCLWWASGASMFWTCRTPLIAHTLH